jgi:hypothetical protein
MRLVVAVAMSVSDLLCEHRQAYSNKNLEKAAFLPAILGAQIVTTIFKHDTGALQPHHCSNIGLALHFCLLLMHHTYCNNFYL